MTPDGDRGDFGAGRAGQIARHAGDAARAVAGKARGDRNTPETAHGVANAVAAAARVVADIAGDAARDARDLSAKYDDIGVPGRIASCAADAKAAAESVADAARKAVYEAAAGDVVSPASDGGRAASDVDPPGPGGDPAVNVSEYIDMAVHDASSGTVEDSHSMSAFAARIAYDAAYAVTQAAAAAACAFHVVINFQRPPVDGLAGDAAAAATAIADVVDPSTASARTLLPTLDEVIARLSIPDQKPAVAEAVKEVAYASQCVSASVRRARAFAVRIESECKAAIDLYD